MSDERAAWWGCAATVVGAAHRLRGQPGQDAAGAWDDNGLTVVADVLGTTSTSTPGTAAYRTARSAGVAVADGHGDRRHPRSGRGAMLAVEAAAEVLRSDREGHALERLVSTWRRRVDEDAERDIEPLLGDASTAYGTTLLAASGRGSSLVVVRVGDGEVGLVDSAGAHASLPPAAPLDVGLTASLAGGGPVVVDVLDVVELQIRAVWLATDGFTNAQADREWRAAVAAQLHERLSRNGHAHVATQLPAWISPAAVDGGDDVSLALLVPPG